MSARPVDCWVPDSAGLPPTRPGPLDGLTLAVKDMIAIEGRTSSFGHPRWRATHAPSASTAPVVSRLLAAGASVAGLAKLDQLAYSLIGNAAEGTPPLNSLYPGRFTGGSSSGPAAAVAAGLADVGLGTDTAGSIRVPAASCGLFGLRPTHGSVSSAGVLPLAPAFDVVGLLARSAGTLGRALGPLSSSSGGARAPAAGRPVMVPADCLDGISAAAAQAVYATARQIASAAGCVFAECRLGGLVSQDAADLFARIQARQVWQAHGPWLSRNGEALAADVRGRVDRAEALSAGPRAQAAADEREWRSYQRGLDRALPHGSLIVLPVIPYLPPQRDASAAELSAFRAGALRYTAPASLAGRPELVIPARHLASGTQLGIGLLGQAHDDMTLLRIAGQLCGEQQQLTV